MITTLSTVEGEHLEEWLAVHDHKCPCYDGPVGAIGGRLTYCFTPTGVGMIVIVKCACGEQVDLSDYDSW